MTTLIAAPKNQSELKFIEEFFRKIGVAFKELSDEEREDMGLTALMKEADRNKKASRETIMRKLKSQ